MSLPEQPPSDPARRSDRSWPTGIGWRRLPRILHDYQWWILAVCGSAAFILGCIGWWKLLREQYPEANDPLSTVAYWSLQSFLINAPGEPDLPWQANVARFLAPVVAGWAGLSALQALFRDRVLQMRIPLMRDHVVICGLGYVGAMFLRRLQDAQIRVVAIESDIANPHIELCRNLGVPVVIGDAQRQRTLHAAGVQRAGRVIAVTADDAVNTQIVATSRQLIGGRSGQLGCLARIASSELCGLLRIQEAHRGDPVLSVDFFNTAEVGARLMLRKFPMDDRCDRPHLLVAHLGDLGMWLIYHAARHWFDTRPDATVRLVITVLDHDAEERVSTLLGRHPALEPVCEFICLATHAAAMRRLRVHHHTAGAPPLNRAYVTAYDDEQGFPTALKLRHELDPDVPVVLALSDAHGVAELLGDVQAAGAQFNIDVFAALEATCTTELVRGGSFEPMARAIHEWWRREQLAAGKPAPLWEQLDESHRQSSRDQARDIPVKLRAIGCAMTPLRDWNAE